MLRELSGSRAEGAALGGGRRQHGVDRACDARRAVVLDPVHVRLVFGGNAGQSGGQDRCAGSHVLDELGRERMCRCRMCGGSGLDQQVGRAVGSAHFGSGDHARPVDSAIVGGQSTQTIG
jgi:hypothetical protein